MDKNKIRNIVGALVILLMYHVFIFVLPFEKTTIFFVSYAFTLIAFVVGGLAVYHAFKREDAKSKFFGFPVARVGIIYLLVQLGLSLVFMILGDLIIWWVPVLLYAAILAVGLLGLIATEMTTQEIVRQDTQLKKDVTMMRAIQSKVRQLAAQCDEPLLKQLAEEIRYSDPVSHENIADAEADLSSAVDQLQQAVSDGDMESVAVLSRQAMALLDERNRLCKLNKH